MDRAEYLAQLKAQIAAGTYQIDDEAIAGAILETARRPYWSKGYYLRWAEQQRVRSKERLRARRAVEREQRERATMATEQFDIQIKGTTADPARTKDMARQFRLRLKNVAEIKTARVTINGQEQDINTDPEPRERD